MKTGKYMPANHTKSQQRANLMAPQESERMRVLKITVANESDSWTNIKKNKTQQALRMYMAYNILEWEYPKFQMDLWGGALIKSGVSKPIQIVNTSENTSVYSVPFVWKQEKHWKIFGDGIMTPYLIPLVP